MPGLQFQTLTRVRCTRVVLGGDGDQLQPGLGTSSCSSSALTVTSVASTNLDSDFGKFRV